MIEISKKFSCNPETTRIVGEDIPYIIFDKLSKIDSVTHGFSTRLGGVSSGDLSSMNLSFTRGDAYGNVIENYKRISNEIGFDYKRLVTTDQTHTDRIRVVTDADIGKGIIKPRDYSDIDGLITNIPNIPLVTYYADCVPLYFVDPVRRVIGLSHSGWKGTIAGIGAKTAEKMNKTFASSPKDIIACIGPSICQDCYEISEDVAYHFKQAFKEEQWNNILKEKENFKYQLDLWNANKIILLESGIPPENIYITDICTCCNKNILFSHRASGGRRGNLAAFLMLNF